MVTLNLGSLTVLVGQLIRFPEICIVWRRSEQVAQLTSVVKEGCFKEISNGMKEIKSKTHLPLLLTTLPYHSEKIKRKFIYRSATGKVSALAVQTLSQRTRRHPSGLLVGSR